MGRGVKPSTAREDIAAIVAANVGNEVGVVDHLPDSIAPPVVLVAWSDPWLKPSTYCEWQARLELIVVAQRLEPGGKLETLEDIVAAILPAIKQSQSYQVIDTTAPYPLQIGSVDYLAASINIQTDLE